jgi:hypothetical protein
MSSINSYQAAYCNSIKDFLVANPQEVLKEIKDKTIISDPDIERNQIRAWGNEIPELQNQLKNFQGSIIFEYSLKRLGKRIDVVLLIHGIVFSLEFKTGEKNPEGIGKDAQQQAGVYAFDLKNFHKASEDLPVCPVLIPNLAPDDNIADFDVSLSDRPMPLQIIKIDALSELINKIVQDNKNPAEIDLKDWLDSPFHPIPSVYEMAISALTDYHNDWINRSGADSGKIEETENKNDEIISTTKNNGQKSIIFLAGVPGSGKTLIGMDIARRYTSKGSGDKAVYSTGNQALSTVLIQIAQEYLEHNSEIEQSPQSQAIPSAVITPFNKFRNEIKEQKPLNLNVFVLDEAQRVWDIKYNSERPYSPVSPISETDSLLDAMERENHWTVIVCLIGLGQHIGDGEKGINEWIESLLENKREWQVYYPSQLLTQDVDPIKNVSGIKIRKNQWHEMQELYLTDSRRSFRCQVASEAANALLSGNASQAIDFFQHQMTARYPIYLSRDLSQAKNWAKQMTRCYERCGLMVSSSGKRLQNNGCPIIYNDKILMWLLKDGGPGLSNLLEKAVDEYNIQGLEIDWGIVGWDLDLVPSENGWACQDISKGELISDEQKRQRIINSYRVLLTRSRQGFVIYIPKESLQEKDGQDYECIYQMLKGYGIADLPTDTIGDSKTNKSICNGCKVN